MVLHLDDVVVASLKKHTKTGRPLGEDRFIDMLELRLGRVLHPLKQGRKKKREK